MNEIGPLSWFLFFYHLSRGTCFLSFCFVCLFVCLFVCFSVFVFLFCMASLYVPEDIIKNLQITKEDSSNKSIFSSYLRYFCWYLYGIHISLYVESYYNIFSYMNKGWLQGNIGPILMYQINHNELHGWYGITWGNNRRISFWVEKGINYCEIVCFLTLNPCCLFIKLF